ncbi:MULTISPECIES: hypothetical protein [Pseudomonas]|uniref:Uncharacterized protein n=1 Tax=Pseudomonas aphyarum TaxID=2942629 RepID=A0ABT5PP18_9PSED|nr:hypothetical protein [Pseudomonas aphyarum]MDD0969343.1 hypothetical protein [Pseudomonas aphyarum]MDD1125558.1 hypothetical protein [Pseudomonas aphyarum]
MLLTLIGSQILANYDIDLATSIKSAGWWQGSVVSEKRLQAPSTEDSGEGWWIVASQTCNLYNPDFCKIPVVELISAQLIQKLEKSYSRGSNPRTLHVEAIGNGSTVYFEVDIQKRIWLNRAELASIGSPDYEVVDSSRDSPDWANTQWLDNFAGWIARSYTRVTLPDEFNSILKDSKIQDVLDGKLMRTNKLYGIYLNISSASEEEWTGNLGLMPPPYFLEISLVTDEDEDPEPIVAALKKSLFEDKISTKVSGDEKLSRADVAGRCGLTIRPAGVTGRNIADTSLLEIKTSIRYTLNDFLSLSGD